ncbi:hypothetical protein [Marinobacter changyiensis]|uniref:hypothetical protein n=1 Tax=Marinobacter changyiensis TaxID=2604091 RepID=UPI001265AB2E|nr:hypothetical protein [Marinobacter changyiensis]
MKSTFVYPVFLSLLLTASPSYGSEWERHLNEGAVAQDASVTMSNDWSELHANRLRQLERGFYQGKGFDIESLPPQAAGPRVSYSGMSRDWRKIEANRRGQLERSMH